MQNKDIIYISTFHILRLTVESFPVQQFQSKLKLRFGLSAAWNTFRKTPRPALE